MLPKQYSHIQNFCFIFPTIYWWKLIPAIVHCFLLTLFGLAFHKNLLSLQSIIKKINKLWIFIYSGYTPKAIEYLAIFIFIFISKYKKLSSLHYVSSCNVIEVCLSVRHSLVLCIFTLVLFLINLPCANTRTRNFLRLVFKVSERLIYWHCQLIECNCQWMIII